MSEIPAPNVSSMASNADSSNVASKLKRNSGDVGWDYGMLIDPTNQDKWKCIKCSKEFSGGFYRIKLHIAGIKGQFVACTKASAEDKKRCTDALDGVKKKKKAARETSEDARNEVEVDQQRQQGDIEDVEVGVSKRPPRTLGDMDRYVSNINLDDKCFSDNKKRRQQNINDALYKERSLQVHQYMARWVYEFGIPFHAVDNDSFRRFVEAVGQFGPGYQPPSQYQLRKPLLKGEVDKIKKELKPQEEEWEKNGCSIMTDAWSDRTRRSIMNLCVNSMGGTSFLSSKEASLDAHTAKYIFEYVDECIENVGEKNVVQVVIDNASNNMAAANLLQVKRPQVFWTPCATHSLNLMLDAIGKLPLFKNPIMRAKNFTVFVYSHHKTLAMMRKRTKRNIIKPGVTRFATAYLTLQSMLEKKEDSRQMVNSREWDDSKWLESKKGKTAYATIAQPSFWNGVNVCVKVFTPLVKVLRLVDGDVKPAMGFVYGELMTAKEKIKEVLKHKEEKYKPILDIVDSKGKGRIDTPIHLTAYMLNPYYYYKIGSTWSPIENAKVMNGVFSCMEMFFPDLDDQAQVINVDLLKYQRKEGAFGRALAIKGCQNNDERYDPVGWWLHYGIDAPTLQKVAMKILSLTTSSSGCERNWSVFEGIHTKKRNRLDTGRMNKLVYVQFNARLINKKKRSRMEKVDVLLANESSRAQSWMVDGVDDDEVDERDDEDDGEIGELQPRRSSRNVIHGDESREPEEDDFVSDGTEDEEEDDEEFDFETESDKEHVIEGIGNEEMED